jgi:hypothetical protein
MGIEDAAPPPASSSESIAWRRVSTQKPDKWILHCEVDLNYFLCKWFFTIKIP